MAEFLLVVEGLAADGADAAMIVDETTYLAALFGHVFAPDDGAVLGYVWCDRHGWVLADEACVCGDCVWEALQAQAEALREQHAAEFGADWLDEGDRGEMAYRRVNAREMAEFPHGEFDDGRRWREPSRALSPLSPGQWASEPCGDPEWTEEALDAAVAYMDEVEERAWLDTMLEEYGDRGERAVLETDSVATIANVHFEGEGYITVYADMSNGRALTLFRYYEDELCFSSQELVGKTKAQALALFHKKDVAYLRS
jgi:hypothetical protein